MVDRELDVLPAHRRDEQPELAPLAVKLDRRGAADRDTRMRIEKLDLPTILTSASDSIATGSDTPPTRANFLTTVTDLTQNDGDFASRPSSTSG